MWNSFRSQDPFSPLSTLRNLQVLHLDASMRSEDCAPSLARVLPSMSTLSEFIHGYNYQDDDGFSLLTKALRSISTLTKLDLVGNGISRQGAAALGELLRSCSQLGWLDVSVNQFSSEGINTILDALRTGLARHTLAWLDLSSNTVDGALAEIVGGTTDAQAILAAYERLVKDQKAQTLRPLNEVKLLVVGNEAVGKTSLIRFLVDQQPRDPDEKKTPRVAIREKIDTKPWSPHGSPITLNVWDFGGQEIMRGTHKFFLTQGSLYLIVLEDRRQDDRSVYEWLATVRSRGGDSPIIVVINKSDGANHLQLDEAGLKRDHPNIVGFMRTSCDDDDRSRQSIDNLRQLLVTTIGTDKRLEHIREPRPSAWLRVKSEIVDLAKESKIVTDDGFRKICEADGRTDVSDNDRIPNEDEQRRVLGMLHDLGAVVAHGLTRTAPLSLRQITLLDPNWLTRAIYEILNSPLVRDQNGEFSREDVSKILDPIDYPVSRHDFIVDMMEHPDVGLAFEIPGKTRHLIPEALQANSPDYSNWPSDSLRFRFEYLPLLPQRLMPRFIVQAHRNLTAQPTRWRTGVRLSAAKCEILVSADIELKRVDIAVDGPPGLRRAALNVVLDDLDEVHRLNPELKPKALVPLPDEPALAVEYDDLLKWEREEGPQYTFWPSGGAKRKYSVQELLDGTRRETRREGAEREAIRHAKSVGLEAAFPPAPETTSTPVPMWVRSLVGAFAAVIAVAGLIYFPDWRLKALAGAAALGALMPLLLSMLHWHRITAGGLLTSGAVQFAFSAFGNVSEPGRDGGGSVSLSGPSDIVSIVMMAAGVLVYAIGEILMKRQSR
jgi:internalin A